MAHIPVVGIYDRNLARRALYASYLERNVPTKPVLIDSARQVQAHAGQVAVLIVSFQSAEERAQVLACIAKTQMNRMVVIDFEQYNERVYGGFGLQGHFVRTVHRLPHIFDRITSILTS